MAVKSLDIFLYIYTSLHEHRNGTYWMGSWSLSQSLLLLPVIFQQIAVKLSTYNKHLSVDVPDKFFGRAQFTVRRVVCQ